MEKIRWKKAFVTEVASRFASGECIEAIAAWAGCEEREIEAVLKENAAAMQEAFDRTEALGGTKAVKLARRRYDFEQARIAEGKDRYTNGELIDAVIDIYDA